MQNPVVNSQADNEALARARYAVYAQRRTMPPRCNPIGILLLVLTLGVLFIGLTMTVIANWPGATSIGENPLRVAGPVLLGCGGLFFILTMILIVLLNRSEQSKWERQLTNLAADRINNSSREILVVNQVMVVNQNQPPVFGVEPYKVRSSSSQGDQEVTSSRGSGAYPVKGRYSVDMMPDPVRRGNQSGKLHDVSLDSDEKVPDPMRVQKKRPTSRKSGSSNASFNNSYSSGAGEADLGVPSYLIPSGQRLSQQGSGSPNGGYMNASFESPDKDARERPGARNGGQKQRSRAAKDERGRRGPTPEASNQMGGEVGRVLDPQQLRVHIRAQPGTAVHITPSATPPSSRRSNLGRTSLNTSGETEI